MEAPTLVNHSIRGSGDNAYLYIVQGPVYNEKLKIYIFNSLSVITDAITAVIATVITPFGGSITCIIVQSFFSTDFLKISSFKLNGKYFIK